MTSDSSVSRILGFAPLEKKADSCGEGTRAANLDAYEAGLLGMLQIVPMPPRNMAAESVLHIDNIPDKPEDTQEHATLRKNEGA